MGDGSGLNGVREQTVREELDRLLEGAAFRTSKRCKEFLRYIVYHTLRGPGSALKERSIGVELFQLPHDFDTGQHTVVRVTASEVRKKLAQHYQAENGSPHPVRIDLPPGSYSAEFKWETPGSATESAVIPAAAAAADSDACPPDAEARIAARPSRFTGRVIACTALAVLAVAGGFSWWRWRASQPRSTSAAARVVGVVLNAPPAGEDLRIMVGSTEPYVDRSGQKWSPDSFFSGGNTMFRPSERIMRTLDPDIYRRLRAGEFRYNIPLKPGSYELHLHFAETELADLLSAESSGEGQRLFRVSANGSPLLSEFDIVADAPGSNVADERVFRNISPAADGYLHLRFSPVRSGAMLSGIEVLPVSPGKVRPIRIRAGWTASWQDSAGNRWLADSYFQGGNALVRTTNPAERGNSKAPDMALYASERWGHFSYAVPVAEGRYRLTLRFCEGHFGARNAVTGGVGSRVFDVYCNGVALLRSFDIFREAGGEGRPVDRSFSGIQPTAQGKIVLTFVPITGMASVNALEIAEE